MSDNPTVLDALIDRVHDADASDRLFIDVLDVLGIDPKWHLEDVARWLVRGRQYDECGAVGYLTDGAP